MEIIEKIKENPVYKQVLSDSYGGIMYDIANHDKYDATEIIGLWQSLPEVQRESQGGIMSGAFNFLIEE